MSSLDDVTGREEVRIPEQMEISSRENESYQDSKTGIKIEAGTDDLRLGLKFASKEAALSAIRSLCGPLIAIRTQNSTLANGGNQRGRVCLGCVYGKKTKSRSMGEQTVEHVKLTECKCRVTIYEQSDRSWKVTTCELEHSDHQISLKAYSNTHANGLDTKGFEHVVQDMSSLDDVAGSKEVRIREQMEISSGENESDQDFKRGIKIEEGIDDLRLGVKFPSKEAALSAIRYVCGPLITLITQKSTLANGGNKPGRICLGCVYGKKRKSRSTGEQREAEPVKLTECKCRVTIYEQSDRSWKVTTCKLEHSGHQISRQAYSSNRNSIGKSSNAGDIIGTLKYELCDDKYTIPADKKNEDSKIVENLAVTCPYCVFGAKNKVKLEHHIKKKHEIVFSECDECDYKTKYKSRLKLHKEARHEGVIHYCDECEYKAIRKRALKEHQDIKHKGIHFPCDQCKYTAKRKMLLKYHKKAEHEGLRFECDLCDYKSKTKVYLRIHKEGYHQGIIYSCLKCDYKTINRNNLTEHSKCKHEGKKWISKVKTKQKKNFQKKLLNHKKKENKEALFCGQCDYKSDKKFYMKQHIEVHHIGVTYKCKQCDYVGKLKSTLNDHTKTEHRGIRFTCDLCEYIAKRKSQLMIHKERDHEGTTYACTQCTSIFKTKKYLAIHVGIVHRCERFSCNKCEYQTKTKVRLKNHINAIHEGGRAIHKCSQCDFSFIWKIRLKKHIEDEHSESLTFQCEICKNNFVKRSEYEHHMEIKHKVFSDKNKRNMCDKCDFSSAKKDLLKTHIKVEHEGFRYKCKLCNFEGKRRNTLKDHNRSAHELIRHSCDQCPYTAKLQSQIKKHIEFKHRGIAVYCDKCDYKTSFNHNLKKHIQAYHTEGFSYACEKCSFKTVWEIAFQTHNKSQHP